MKKNLPLFVLVCTLLLCHSLFAQKKDVPGYYTTVQGDTVRGLFPGYGQWNRTPSQVDFTISGTTTPVQLTPQKAGTLVIGDYDIFQAYTGPRLLNPIDDDVVFSQSAFSSLLDSIGQVNTFLRKVAATTGGDVYVLHDNSRTNFFYQLPGQAMTELRYKKSFDQVQIRENAGYRQQLQNLFGEAINQKGLSATLEQLRYTAEDLSAFFQALFPATKAAQRPQNKSGTWVISAGVVLNAVKIKGDKVYSGIPASYGTSLSPLLTIGYLQPFDRNFGRYFFNPQLTVFKYKNTNEVIKGAYTKATTFQSDLSVVGELSGGMNFINRDEFKCFFTGGLGLMAQVNAKQVNQLYTASDHSPYGGATATSMPLLTWAFDASLGVSVKKLVVSAGFMVPTNIGNFVFYRPRLSGFNLKVGYRLRS